MQIHLPLITESEMLLPKKEEKGCLLGVHQKEDASGVLVERRKKMSEFHSLV